MIDCMNGWQELSFPLFCSCLHQFDCWQMQLAASVPSILKYIDYYAKFSQLCYVQRNLNWHRFNFNLIKYRKPDQIEASIGLEDKTINLIRVVLTSVVSKITFHPFSLYNYNKHSS